MAKVLKADSSAGDAFAAFDFADQTDLWVTFDIAIPAATLASWTTFSGYFVALWNIDIATDLGGAYVFDTGSGLVWVHDYAQAGTTPPIGDAWHTIEYHAVLGPTGEDVDLYVDGALVDSEPGGGPPTDADPFQQIQAGVVSHASVVYLDNVKIGTTRGGTEIFSDDFEDGTLDAWSITEGDVSIVDDPFPDVQPQGIVWSPAAATLDEFPTWVRLDSDTGGYRLADGFTITRGRQDVNDKTATGTATITFRDTNGYLDPTNPSGPWYGNLDPMKQAAINLKNPVTDEWHMIFRGFVAGPDHELDMFTTERGFDRVSWQLVDAFDLFANVILTHGVHGHTPSLATFPNIYYQGTPANLTGESDVFVHVDQRIAKLLDDAGWPNTGETRAGLRNIFSGNVSVQGTVYARKDSLLSALFDAADAEFPGVANIYVAKDGVVTFHGRFARFLWETHPGYGINHWYVGTRDQAEIDDTVVPFQGPLRFYRSKDDIINASYALPQGVDETDGGVVHASDATSQSTYGYRSENFEGLIVSAGHDDLGDPTTAVEEANKFSDYIVGNYKDPKTRVGTLKLRSRRPGTVGATALWDMMTRVEIGDVVTVTTSHAGGGGFDEDFFVEQIRYSGAPLEGDYWDVQLELEVSPATFFGYNPFGEVDEGVS